MKKKIDEDYHLLAKVYGYTWLGPLPKDNSFKTAWKCQKDHT
jgi:hypothetical protein